MKQIPLKQYIEKLVNYNRYITSIYDRGFVSNSCSTIFEYIEDFDSNNLLYKESHNEELRLEPKQLLNRYFKITNWDWR